jgi:ribosomal protein S18 acetylase RimI-like enzyme
MTPPVIRKATPAEAEVVKAITDAAYHKYIAVIGRLPQPMTADYSQMAGEHDIWLLSVGEQVVGLIVLMNKPDHILIYNLAIRPEQQHRGWGRRLLAWAETEAARQGYHLIRLYTNALMEGNVAYYQRYGYGETGREDYLGSTLVYMEKRLE